jgi:hypothetical protein
MDMYVDEQFLDAIQGEILWLIVPFLQKKIYKLLWIWRGEPKHVLTNMCIMGLLFLARKTPMHS